MIKRAYSAEWNFILIIVITFIMMLGHTVMAAIYEDRFEYELQSGIAVITKYIGNSAQALIPEKIAGTSRISIRAGTFTEQALSKVVILNNVKTIEEGTFAEGTKTVIYGKHDSTAERYAKENNIEFRVYGDINGDGNVSATDTLKVKRHIVELSGYILNEDEQMRADINCDGKVTTTDLLTLKKVIVGLDEPEQSVNPEEPEEPEENNEMPEEIVELNNLKWNKDYYYGERDSEEWKVNRGAVEIDEWKKTWNGEISRIRVPGDEFNGAEDEIEIIGNNLIEGKGAAWAEVENGDISHIEFDYLIDCKDSIEEAGIMLNVEKNGDTLEGYMIGFTANVIEYLDIYGDIFENRHRYYKVYDNYATADDNTTKVVLTHGPWEGMWNKYGWGHKEAHGPELFDRYAYSNVLIRGMKNIPKKIYDNEIIYGRKNTNEDLFDDTTTVWKRTYMPMFKTETRYDGVYKKANIEVVFPDLEITDWVSNYLGRNVTRDDLSGVICKFKYKINDNHNLMYCENGELELIDVFNAGKWKKIDVPTGRCENISGRST